MPYDTQGRRRLRAVRDDDLQFRTDGRIMIVGGGPSAVAAADELRRLGFPGTITVLSAEADAPYDRPACSKSLLTGHNTPRTVVMDRPANVDWRVGRAIALDPERKTLTDDTGTMYPFDGMIIATGGRAGFPKDWPVDAPGLHLLNNISEAWGLRQDLRRADRIAIVGGGLTGCETACSIHALAREAVIIDPNPFLMRRAVGEPIGTLMTEVHYGHGTELRLGRRVKHLDRSYGRWRLTLDDGEVLFVDIVVMSAGERPSVDWLQGSGLDVSNGVLCDERLRVVGTDGILAAGSLARWPNLRYSTRPDRCGQWIAALEHGVGAARTLLAGNDAPPVTLLPRFWSSQHDLRLQVAGQLDPDADIQVTEMRPGRRDVARAGVLATYFKNGMLTGVAGINAPFAFNATVRSLLAQRAQRREIVTVRPAQRLAGVS